jgi:hypothetical protein
MPVMLEPSASDATQVATSLSAPDTIGQLRKRADQSALKQALAKLSNGGVEHPFGVIYDDAAAPGRTAIVWGTVGKAFGMGAAQTRLDSAFSSTSPLTGTAGFGPRTDVDPGAVSGKAQCAKTEGLGVAMTVCFWSGSDALLGFMFGGLGLNEGKERLLAMLPAIVIVK